MYAGHAYQLSEEDIDSIETLASSDPGELADNLETSDKRLNRWVKIAQYLQSRPVDVLPGIAEGRKENLQGAGITTVGDLAVANVSDVANSLDINEDTAKRYRRKAVERPMQPVTEVSQIGEGKGSTLATVGIKTIADLVASDPDSVAPGLDGITADFLRDRIEDA